MGVSVWTRTTWGRVSRAEAGVGTGRDGEFRVKSIAEGDEDDWRQWVEGEGERGMRRDLVERAK